MLSNARPVAFLASTDLDRSRSFFVARLGLTEVEETPYALVLETVGATLRVALVDGFVPQPFTVFGWVVDDVTAVDVEPVRFEGMDQDADGVWTTPNGDRVRWFRDPDANLLSLTSLTRA